MDDEYLSDVSLRNVAGFSLGDHVCADFGQNSPCFGKITSLHRGEHGEGRIFVKIKFGDFYTIAPLASIRHVKSGSPGSPSMGGPGSSTE